MTHTPPAATRNIRVACSEPIKSIEFSNQYHDLPKRARCVAQYATAASHAMHKNLLYINVYDKTVYY